jgi:hypothetical protein
MWRATRMIERRFGPEGECLGEIEAALPGST